MTYAQNPIPKLGKSSGLRNILANLGHLLGGKAAAGIVGMGSVVIVTRTLGATEFGVLVLINAYVGLIGSLITLSGFHGVVRFGTIALEADDRDGLARMFRFMTLTELSFGAVAIVVAALGVPVIGPRLGWPPHAVQLGIPYSLAVIAMVRATPQGLLQIAQRFDLIGIHQAVTPTIRLAGSLIVWFLGGGLEGFVMVWLVAALAEGLAMWLLSFRVWQKLLPGQRLIGPWRGVLGTPNRFGRFIMINNFDLTLRQMAPNLVPLTVGWWLGPAAAGVFSLATRAANLLQKPALLLSQASYSVLAAQVARGEHAEFRRTVWNSVALALLVATPIFIALVVSGDGFMRLIGGKSFGGNATLLTLVALSRLVTLTASPLGAGLTALGRPQRSMSVALLTNVVFYPLLILLLDKAAIEGAGWHALIQAGVDLPILAIVFIIDARSPRHVPLA